MMRGPLRPPERGLRNPRHIGTECRLQPPLIQIILEALGTARVTQLAQCLSLYLTYTLAGDVEHLSDLLERSRSAVVKTETELEHLLLSR